MRSITKQTAPNSLTTHRMTQHADYNNYADKDSLRRALRDEQRGICCYCMGRIYSNSNSMKVEHWKCRSRYPLQELDYNNLLGVCHGGGSGQPRDKQHCDSSKKNQDLKWNPSDPSRLIEDWIWYETEGGIRSDDQDFDQQLNNVLNLNIEILKESRKKVLDGVLQWWRIEKDRLRQPLSKQRFQEQRTRKLNGTGELSAFCQVAVWWLDQRIAKL